MTPKQKQNLPFAIGGILAGIMALLSVFVIFQSIEQSRQIVSVFDGWMTDLAGYNRATTEYQTDSSKPMIVYFYADWCPHCKHLKETVLSTPRFQDYAKKYIRVNIQPDHGKGEEALMHQYGATGYPSLYVIPPNKPEGLPFEAVARKIEAYNDDASPRTPAEFNAAMEAAITQTAGEGEQ